MTEDKILENKGSAKEFQIKKRQFILLKIVAFLALIFFGYFGFKYWQAIEIQKLKAKIEAGKFDNVESEIFDLSDEYKNQEGADDTHTLSDLTVNELREKGPEFIYQMLLKNQLQITDLKGQIQELKTEFLKYKNHEKIGRLIFTYIDLRQKFYAGEPYEEAIKNFEMLSYFDKDLLEKIAKLKTNLKNFQTAKKLSKDLQNLIPEIIYTKNNTPVDNSFFAKIRRQISKLIVIRRIDGKTSDVDTAIAKAEKFLNEENFQEALNIMLSLDKNYHQILVEFLDELSVASDTQRLDQEIMNYLKSLT